MPLTELLFAIQSNLLLFAVTELSFAALNLFAPAKLSFVALNLFAVAELIDVVLETLLPFAKA